MKSELEILKTLMERVRENTPESHIAFLALKKINPTYHFCVEWDGALICDKDTEYEACLCSREDNGHS